MNGAMMLPEFDHEMANTRKTLERVTDDMLAFSPHEKSWTALQLAGHLARLPGWVSVTLESTELDLEEPFPQPELESSADILATFDEAVNGARAALEGASSEDLMVPWTLKMGEHEAFTMPRVGVLRSFVMNHIIHHRGQLTVYLRLNGAPVPALYGPSADEE